MTAPLRRTLVLLACFALASGCATAERGSGGQSEGALRASAPDVRADAYYHYSVAQTFAQNGEFKDAIAAMQDAIKRDPNSAFLWTTLAQWYGRVDAPAEAVAAARRAVEIAPGQVATHMTLADLLRAQAGSATYNRPANGNRAEWTGINDLYSRIVH